MNFASKLLKQTDLLIGVGVIVIVSMLILPMPQWALDAGLVAAIAASVVILLSAVNVSDPLEFSVFPSLLLITTLFRVALSIAATKLILGSGTGGHVIETFGNFVMAGDPVVGFVAFLILVIVQFIVITNGAGRVAEVVARFTLDAMPGKQMAIDADLAAGLIDENGARARRKQIKKEADFYGAMDGASKFVKGDAVASILIIAVNIIGGFVVGFMRGGSDAMTILKTYSLLSVGEGLVSQLPALMISTASGLMVTRAGQERNMGSEVAMQVLGQPKAILFAGCALCALGFVPGFPATLFVGVGLALFALYRFLSKNANIAKLFPTTTPEEKPKPVEKPAPQGPEAVMPLLAVDQVEIEIGYGLTKLADPKVGGDLSERITATRRQIALEIGFVMPTVRIRDSVHLNADEYILKIRGEEVARAVVMPDHLLAVNSGAILHAVPGSAAKDPVFGLDALWIESDNRDAAVRAGYTVIEPSAVISTHLAETVKTYAAELLTRQDVQTLIDNAKAANSAVIEELVPNVLQLGDVQKVLQHLLRERVPIRDMVTILETMADYGSRIKDPDQLGEIVRSAIARTITRQFLDTENKLYCITLEPTLERDLVEQVKPTTVGTTLSIDSGVQRELVAKLQAQMDQAMAKGYQAVLLCSTTLRLPLRRILEKALPSLHVLAYNEVASRADVEFVGQVLAA
ncbi:MAG TPA: flagellar biosynthesis protein FlhA [Fimbriimonadaceae bacterium]|nr:flagellar biosynthesis protein FlhA [Fimbriimonadaceae bacterium]